MTLPLVDAAPAVPVTPLVETPAVPPVPPAPVAAPIPAPVDPRIAALEAENAQFKQQAAMAKLTGQAGQYAAQLEAQGWLPEHAAAYSQLWFKEQQATMRQADVEAQLEAHARMIVTERLAKQFSVPVEVLAGYTSPQAMEAAAQRYSTENKRIAGLEAEIAKLKGATVPAQHFDGGAGGTQPVANADNIDALFMEYERKNPKGPNPYTAQYRKFLGM